VPGLFGIIPCLVGRLPLGPTVHSLPGVREDLGTYEGLTLPPPVGNVVWYDELFLWPPSAMVTVGAQALHS
jgi:hypothetical protein